MPPKTPPLFRLVAFSAVALLFVGCSSSRVQVSHPYEKVNWDRIEQHKANLHTHTTLSDGKADPAAVIDLYHELGYTILALTDHDSKGPESTTWPWSEFDRDPKELGMIAIEGNEISNKRHINSLFSDYANADVESEEIALEEIGHHHGEAVFNHPGKYTRKEGAKRTGVDWQVSLYRQYDHLLGMEIYNQNDRFPEDRETWDMILTDILPDRQVWGFANDDMHRTNFVAHSWNVMLLPKLTEKKFRKALQRGCFFFAHSPVGVGGPAVPVIELIEVDERAETIHIDASGDESIEWISEGQVIHRGDTLDLSTLTETTYVRAVIHGAEETVIGTQPFTLSYD